MDPPARETDGPVRGPLTGSIVGSRAELLRKMAKAEDEKSVTERKSFGELFWPQRKNFSDRWWIQKPYKNQEKKAYIFPLWTPFFFCKEKFCTGAGRCMLSFPQQSIGPQPA